MSTPNPIPTDALGAAIWTINLIADVLAIDDIYQRLSTDITAQAEAEGRDVTDDEQAIIDAGLAESEKERDGTAGAIQPTDEPPAAA